MALLLLLALLPIAVILVDAADNNPVFNPCRQLLPVGGKDSISIAVGYTGAPSVWYNNSDPSLNQLSPCDNALVAKMPANSRVAVFRPLLDQISMLRTNNASYLDLHTAVIYQTSTIEEHSFVFLFQFPGNATVVAYAGNPTIVSTPKYFLIPYGRIPIYTLVIELKKGVLKNLLWKDDKCASCGGKTSASCFQGACSTSESTCLDPSSTIASVKGADPCRFAINVAFSGTDKNNVVMDSWYQVKSMEQYSITSLFGQAGNALSQVGLSIIDDQLGG
ncbi:uncharacterized protein LOC9645484 [Selaginella moellendorffii]|uniref:uncharacterized protein LOC9645484 n=1 Tax=Selaginella moellendorffii TaxID=88036 RepID=UPI000D1C6C4B|nr:uncharacterized protein LOC9645484 [Selaginella moellendorffii]|eukprot:XP_024536158.1 uncharacterized protein LOC9645484 [Selaginella moellendorffii]